MTFLWKIMIEEGTSTWKSQWLRLQGSQNSKKAKKTKIMRFLYKTSTLLQFSQQHFGENNSKQKIKELMGKNQLDYKVWTLLNDQIIKLIRLDSHQLSLTPTKTQQGQINQYL